MLMLEILEKTVNEVKKFIEKRIDKLSTFVLPKSQRIRSVDASISLRQRVTDGMLRRAVVYSCSIEHKHLTFNCRHSNVGLNR